MRETTIQVKSIYLFVASTVIMLALVFFSLQSVHATMYACRTADGGVSFTNVPSNDQCKPLLFRNKSTSSTIANSSFFGSYSKSNGSKGSAKFDSYIQTTASRYGVDPLLIKAIIHIESGFNHRAVSNKGAKGLMQLMPGTARDLRVWNPFDPLQNIEGGTRYFRKIMDDFGGNLKLSLAAYNAGPGLVERIGKIPSIPETREYVQKVLSQYRYYKFHED